MKQGEDPRKDQYGGESKDTPHSAPNVEQPRGPAKAPTTSVPAPAPTPKK